MGVPMGLWFAAHYSWRAPFLALAILSVSALCVAWFLVPTLDAHLHGNERRRPVAQLRAVFGVPNHLRAFAFMIALMASVFMVVPFIAAYYVANVGVAETELPYIYFAGGLATLFTAPLIGWLADRLGKKRVFTVIALVSLVPIVVMTHLPPVPLAGAVAASVLFFVFVPGRFGPAVALITGSVAPRLRGSFMSFNGSVQQLAAGAASLVAGLIIGRGADGALTGFDWAGWCAVAATIVAVLLALRIRIVPDGSGGPD
jgi:predicted MFS family arabinose efflux permease